MDGKRKLPVEMLHAVGAPLLVGMNDDLGIGFRAEFMACLFQFTAKLKIIEYLAVERDPD